MSIHSEAVLPRTTAYTKVLLDESEARMIWLTAHHDGRTFAVNPRAVVTVEPSPTGPYTVITTVSGATLVVAESADRVVDDIRAAR